MIEQQVDIKGIFAQAEQLYNQHRENWRIQTSSRLRSVINSIISADEYVMEGTDLSIRSIARNVFAGITRGEIFLIHPNPTNKYDDTTTPLHFRTGSFRTELTETEITALHKNLFRQNILPPEVLDRKVFGTVNFLVDWVGLEVDTMKGLLDPNDSATIATLGQLYRATQETPFGPIDSTHLSPKQFVQTFSDLTQHTYTLGRIGPQFQLCLPDPYFEAFQLNQKDTRYVVSETPKNFVLLSE